LGPRKFNVYLVQLFDGRQVRGMRVPSQKPADSSAVLIQGMERKRLDISRIAAIRTAAGVPLTLHGGSGTDDEDFRKAIQAGIAMIHINTELRVAWRRGLEEALRRNADSVAPYKLLPEVMEKVKAVVVKRLKLFSGNS
jgi:fructose-bisphosphate aldolase class II